MDDAMHYDPERHDNQIVAAFETVAAAGHARDALLGAGVGRAATHVVASDAEPVESQSVGDQVLGAFMGLFSSRDDHPELAHAVRRGHALLAVDVQPGADRHRIVEILEANGALEFQSPADAAPSDRAAADSPGGTAPAERREGRREASFGSNRVRSYIADRS